MARIEPGRGTSRGRARAWQHLLVKSILRSAAGAVVAGAAGTAAMTLSYAAERRLRHHEGPLDYDDSLVPGQIVASVLRLPAVTDREAAELGTLLRWGYGSAFGVAHRGASPSRSASPSRAWSSAAS